MNESTDNQKGILDATKQIQDPSHINNQADLTKVEATSQAASEAEEAVDPIFSTGNEFDPTKSGVTPGSYKRECPENLTPWEDPVTIAQIADDTKLLLQRHCVLTEPEINAIVLWIIASYDIDPFRVFAKLALISPEKRCGKTTVMELIAAMCKDAMVTANTTPAILYRLSSLFRPTLLIDEADTFVKGGDPELIGIINSGHTRSSAYVLRCQGDTHEPRRHSTWMPMVLASIGDLPDTIMDRSIVVNLRRKKSNEHVERLPANLDQQCLSLRRKLIKWRSDNLQAIYEKPIEPPAIGSDRAVDNWSPLFTIANLISPKWLGACKAAYQAMTVIDEPQIQTELLRDIRDVFKTHSEKQIRSTDLCELLNADPEKPWSSMGRKGALDPRSVAKLLAPYKIGPVPFRSDQGIVRGYNRDHFKDAFERYLS